MPDTIFSGVSDLKVLIHAPSATALGRARNNAVNLKREAPGADVRIVANAQAVAAALDEVNESTDQLIWLCPVTLERLQRPLREPLNILGHPAILEIVLMQQAGWVYIRA
jgi:intracellular sulfur oxidation DsrE/DsrF family protein